METTTQQVNQVNLNWDVREEHSYFTWACSVCGAAFQTYSESPHGEAACEDCGRVYRWAMAIH